MKSNAETDEETGKVKDTFVFKNNLITITEIQMKRERMIKFSKKSNHDLERGTGVRYAQHDADLAESVVDEADLWKVSDSQILLLKCEYFSDRFSQKETLKV